LTKKVICYSYLIFREHIRNRRIGLISKGERKGKEMVVLFNKPSQSRTQQEIKKEKENGKKIRMGFLIVGNRDIESRFSVHCIPSTNLEKVGKRKQCCPWNCNGKSFIYHPTIPSLLHPHNGPSYDFSHFILTQITKRVKYEVTLRWDWWKPGRGLLLHIDSRRRVLCGFGRNSDERDADIELSFLI